MQSWPTEPDRQDHTIRMDLLRVQPGKPLSGIVTCRLNAGAYTHYWRGRTVKCTGPDDEPCKAGRVPRWYGFLSVWAPKTGNVALFEYTPACVQAVKAHLHTYGTLRSAHVKLERRNWKTNSTVVMTLTPGPFADDKIPKEPNIVAHLEHMWEIHITQTPESLDPRSRTTYAHAETNGHAGTDPQP